MARFVITPSIEQRIGRLAGILPVLARHAERGADHARRIAPVATGAYRDSIEPDAGFDTQGPFGRINAQDFKALWIEFGTKDQPARASLRRALDSIRGGR